MVQMHSPGRLSVGEYVPKTPYRPPPEKLKCGEAQTIRGFQGFRSRPERVPPKSRFSNRTNTSPPARVVYNTLQFDLMGICC